MDFQQAYKAILEELSGALAKVEPERVAKLVEAIEGAKRVFVVGAGRSGLMVRTFAMRLMQMGLEAHVVGETTTPSMRPGDVLVAVSGSGETASTVLFAENAKKAQGRVAAVLADRHTKLGGIADILMVIPGRARTGVGMDSMQMPGSLFEQAAFMFFDAAVTTLVQKRGESYPGMSKRHTNLQ